VKGSRLCGVVVAAAVLSSGCGSIPPLVLPADVDALPFAATVTEDGWAQIRVPVCAGDRGAYFAAYTDTDTGGTWPLYGRAGAAPATVVAVFVINAETLRDGTVTSDVPRATSDPFSPLPATLDDETGFMIASPRGYVVIHFADLDWKPGESWTYHPTFAKTEFPSSPSGEYLPYETRDETVLRGVCAP
jgi:hypothetical protein